MLGQFKRVQCLLQTGLCKWSELDEINMCYKKRWSECIQLPVLVLCYGVGPRLWSASESERNWTTREYFVLSTLTRKYVLVILRFLSLRRIAENCLEFVRVDGSCWKWMKVDESWWEWMKVNESGWELMRVNESGWKWMRVDESEWKWMKVNESRWELMRVNESGWKWMRVDESEWKWMRIDESGWKWMKVDESWWEWMKVDESWWEWMKVDGSCWEWMKVDESWWEWMKVDESWWEWMKVNESGWKLLRVNESGWKWMRVVESGWDMGSRAWITELLSAILVWLRFKHFVDIPDQIKNVKIVALTSTTVQVTWKLPTSFCSKFPYCLTFDYHARNVNMNQVSWNHVWHFQKISGKSFYVDVQYCKRAVCVATGGNQSTSRKLAVFGRVKLGALFSHGTEVNS